MTDKPRAKLTPNPAQSLGHGLGQQTGGTADSDRTEALNILRMIESVDWDNEAHLSTWFRAFVSSQLQRSHGPNYRVTGRELFKLRDAKDELIKIGVL